MVDAVASLGCMPFDMDGWGMDVAMAGSQKGLMTPPGLAFVAANDRAREAHQAADLRTLYWDWTFREGEIHYQKYCGTPPEHLLFALRKALDMLLAEGLEAAFRRHALLAQATRLAVSAGPRARCWPSTSPIRPSARIRSPASSCRTVILGRCLLLPRQMRCRSRRRPRRAEGKAFRIAHMGYSNAPMLLGTLGAVEMGLKSAGHPARGWRRRRRLAYLGDAVPA